MTTLKTRTADAQGWVACVSFRFATSTTIVAGVVQIGRSAISALAYWDGRMAAVFGAPTLRPDTGLDNMRTFLGSMFGLSL